MSNIAMQKYSDIELLIQNNQIKDAIDLIKSIISKHQNWALTERINKVETDYRYMLKYITAGKHDPDKQKVYFNLIRNIFAIYDDAKENVLLNESSQIYFKIKRTANQEQEISLGNYQDSLHSLQDSLSVMTFLENEENNRATILENRKSYEAVGRKIFDHVFVQDRADSDLIMSYTQFIGDQVITNDVKCLFVSALTLNIMQKFDSMKVNFLLELCNNEDEDIAIRAIIGIIPIFQVYDFRLKYYPECIDRLKVLSENPVFVRRFMSSIIGFIKSSETEKITRKLKDEILPEMMRLSPIIGKKIQLDEWISEIDSNDKNPEWQKILDESGITDKLREISDLQLEGSDVFHSTFSNLKNYPFFQQIGNWFLPFSKNNSNVMSLFSGNEGDESLVSVLTDSSVLCNSDKYSLCFTLISMPDSYKNIMLNQLNMENEQIKELKDEEQLLNNNQKEETKINHYIQDLYRFHKLFYNKHGFTDIFELNLNYIDIQAFSPIVTLPDNVEKIALYFFDKNKFEEALSAYTLLAELKPGVSEIWQKIGFSKQVLGDVRGALNAYLRADLIEENNSWVLERIGSCYRILKEPKTALLYYSKLEDIKPNDLRTQINIGHCYLELSDFETALNYYFKVELIDSNNTKVWRSIAWSAFLSKKFDVSKRYYGKILENGPKLHDYLNAGHVEYCSDRIDEAIALYKKARLQAKDAESFRELFINDKANLENLGADTSSIPEIIDSIEYDIQEEK
ncbi:MAG: tetratricopeptide repeat protein [Fermentimonas sp.]|jgi:hypothetical protein